MSLDWMGENRELVEKFIRLFNTYARQYTKVHALEGTSIKTSSAQIQTLEYIIETDGQEKMSEIAARIGVTRATFSNNVKKLIDLGYLQKSHNRSNQKDIYVTATPQGLQAYREYSEFIYKSWFHDMFALADQIPAEYVEVLKKMLDGFTDAFNASGSTVRPKTWEERPTL